MAMETPHVFGIPDPRTRKTEPSPKTAFGVFQGMKACAEEVFPDKSLRDKTVAIQGTGNVGQYLIGELLKEGAKLIVTDISVERLKNVLDNHKGIETVGAEEYIL